MHTRFRDGALAALLALAAATQPVSAAAPVTPAALLSAAPDADWEAYKPEDLLVIDLAGGGRVVIALADAFAPIHVANIRRLAHAHWYDGLVIERVQDNYVVQWGDADGKKVLPADINRNPPAEYERAAEGLAFQALPYRDAYAGRVGSVGGMPAAENDGLAWLVHCYGMVGVGRDLAPDTGTGAELYAVIGQPPRALDRNIAVVGRVLSGMEVLTALPRGSADMGFYAEPGQRRPIQHARLAADLPAAERPRFDRLKEGGPTLAAWLRVKANRQDSFFVRPAGALDVCNAMPPVRARN